MAKKDKKAKSAKLPKRIAGVKIPKPLRRQGHHLAELARHPLVADVAAAALVALAGSLRESPKVRGAAAKAGDAAGDAAHEAGSGLAKAAELVIGAVSVAAAGKAARRKAAEKASPATGKGPADPKTTH